MGDFEGRAKLVDCRCEDDVKALSEPCVDRVRIVVWGGDVHVLEAYRHRR